MDSFLSGLTVGMASLSFCATIWRTWRDKPRLDFYVRKIRFVDKHTKEDLGDHVQIKACNIGFRPIILKRFMAIDENPSSGPYYSGIDDEPSATYGKQDQKFPSIINPGKTLTFHPMIFDVLKRNAASEFSWQYFVLEDSFNRFYYLSLHEISFRLGMDKQFIPWTNRRKFLEWFKRKKLLKQCLKRDQG